MALNTQNRAVASEAAARGLLAARETRKLEQASAGAGKAPREEPAADQGGSADIVHILQWCGGEFGEALQGIEPADLRSVIDAVAGAHKGCHDTMAPYKVGGKKWEPWRTLPVVAGVFNQSFANMNTTGRVVVDGDFKGDDARSP